MSSIIEIALSEDLEKLTHIFTSDETVRERIRNDFLKGYFNGLMSISTTGSILGYIIYYNTYSTWQHRVYFVSDIWLSDDLDDGCKFSEFKCMLDKLLTKSQENEVNRINMNLSIDNRKICDWIKLIGGIDLSEKEDWLIMEMQSNEIKDFVSETSDMAPGYKLVKVTNIEKYSSKVKELIRELAIFEELEEQLEITEEGLIRDFQWNDRTMFTGNIVKNRYYELAALIKEETDKETGDKLERLIGFSIYFLTYNLKNGVGFVMEDLYVKKEYRGSGLGTSLWRFVINDILAKHNITFMQWTCLKWNTKALEFYKKYKSRNLTALFNIHFFRFVKEVIYSNV